MNRTDNFTPVNVCCETALIHYSHFYITKKGCATINIVVQTHYSKFLDS